MLDEQYPGVPDNIPELTDEYRLELQVSRTADLMRVAKDADIKFKLSDAAIVVGEEQPTVAGNVWQSIKDATPLLTSRQQKLEKIVAVQHGEALQQDEEFDTYGRLTSWFSSLSGEQRQQVTVTDTNYGDPYLSPLRLTVQGHDTHFELGHHFNFDAFGGVGDLPAAAQERLEDKKTFWQSFGVQNGAALEVFVEDHFDKVPVTFDGEDLPEEIEWLEATDPAAYDKLRTLQQETGHDMHLWRLKKSPDSTIEDVLSVAINSQEKYISTWLHSWVKREHTPVILDSDIQAIREAHAAVSQSLRNSTSKKLTDYRRAYLMHDLDTRLEADADFDTSLENMQRLRSLVLGVEIAAPCDEHQRSILDEANVLLDQELSGERVADRLITDTVLRTSEGIKQVLKVVSMLVPGAYGLEQVPVKAIADSAKAVGSGDDLVGEVGEIRGLHAQGYKWGELMRRFGIIIPVAVGAVALGTQIENIGEVTNNLRFAAGLYALTTFITSAATLGLTTYSFAKSYEKLAAQGKLVEQPYLDHETRLKMHAAIKESDTTEEVTAAVEEFMQALVDNPDVSEREIQKRARAIEEAARAGKLKQAMVHVAPTKREAYAAAYQEVFRINPVREGKLWAMPVMLGSAVILGGELLASPFFYVPFGMGEALGGLGLAKFADLRDGARWRKKVRGYTEAADNSQGS